MTWLAPSVHPLSLIHLVIHRSSVFADVRPMTFFSVYFPRATQLNLAVFLNNLWIKYFY